MYLTKNVLLCADYPLDEDWKYLNEALRSLKKCKRFSSNQDHAQFQLKMECVTSKYKSILSKKVEILLLQILTDPVVTEVSQKLGKSVPQVLLRWAVQQGIGMLLSVYLNISQSSDVHNKFIQI